MTEMEKHLLAQLLARHETPAEQLMRMAREQEARWAEEDEWLHRLRPK
jgi:hypothetical protein